jgi:hypothetical protein
MALRHEKEAVWQNSHFVGKCSALSTDCHWIITYVEREVSTLPRGK